MLNVVLDEKKIDNLVSSYQDAEQLIFEGSDEHLDAILNLQNSLKKLARLSHDVNEELERTFNFLNEEKAKEIVIKLATPLRQAKQLITVLRTLHVTIADGTKSCRKELVIETKQIDEFVQDLIKYKINNPSTLKELLNEIK